MNTTQDDGGPAFPFQPRDRSGYPCAEHAPGMSLRDWLMGMSISPVIRTAIHQGVTLDFEEIALNASRIADAVITLKKNDQ